jgi:F0F1-type ATP synthase membrane subunit c/vacuolar-type H+-ATPase subunit K
MIGPIFLHYLSVVVAIVLSSMGKAIGQGVAGFGSVFSINRQPMGINEGFRALVIGMALTESGCILALVIGLLILFTGFETITWGIGFAEMGIGLAIGCTAAVVGIASGFSVRATCTSISRQPFFSQKIVTLMLLTQSMIEAPVIFAFIVALLIKLNITPTLSLFDGIKFCAAGVVMGIGAIGPSIGQAFFADAACASVGINRKAYQRIFAFTCLCQAIIETPVIFCLLLSTLILYRPISLIHPFLSIISFCSAAFCLGFGSIGTGISTGYVASRSCYQMAMLSRSYGTVFRATLLAQVFIESAVIYAMIVALLLIMRVT